MKHLTFFISLFLISCSTNEKKDFTNTQTEIENNKKVIKSNKTFEEIQDSLRIVLLNSKPNENLKSSLLQELYIRGLINQEKDKIKFDLPFNLHGFDCGAPDCYTTEIKFEIIAKEPIEFPETIDFTLKESGCGIENEIIKNGRFNLKEESSDFVNYYSIDLKSNLVILKEKLYYFSEVESNTIKIELLDKLFEKYDDEDAKAIEPFQSTIMTTTEYEHFL